MADGLAVLFGNPDPASWRNQADSTSFEPGLMPNTMRETNRPVFQQVLELRRR